MQNKAPAEAMSRSRFPDGFRILKGNQEYVTYIEHSSLRVWYSETPSHYDSHYHSAVEVILPITGEVIYTVADSTYRVQSNEVLIVPPNTVHSLFMHEGSSRYLLLFEPDHIFGMRDMPLIDELLQQPVYLTGDSLLTASVRALLLQAVECYNRKEPMWNSMCYAYLLQMYVRIGQDYLSRSLLAEPAEHRMDTEIVDSARLYVDQNYMRDINLDDVAAFSGFSKYYFSRMFKQELGISFSEYLRQKRVSVAEERLIHSSQSIQEIAVAAGFGSIATFNRVFKEAKNCTPSRYREIYSDFL